MVLLSILLSVNIKCILYNKITVKNMHFLLYMYYMHPGYRTSICGKNSAYYIRIFTVCDIIIND